MWLELLELATVGHIGRCGGPPLLGGRALLVYSKILVHEIYTVIDVAALIYEPSFSNLLQIF